MPETVAVAIASAFSGSAVTGFATGAASALSVGAGTAFVYAASYVATAAAISYGAAQLTKPRESGRSDAAFPDQGRSVMVRSPGGARRKIYGQVMTSGLMYPVGVAGTLNEDFHFVVVYAAHEVEELGDLYFGDELIPLDGGAGGAATGRYAGHVLIGPHHGDAGQAADAALLSAFPGVWTSDHRGAGIAYDAVRLKHSPDLFPYGLPNIRRMIKGAKVYDPRDVTQDVNDRTTWKWSANAALCTADYLNDPILGKGVLYD